MRIYAKQVLFIGAMVLLGCILAIVLIDFRTSVRANLLTTNALLTFNMTESEGMTSDPKDLSTNELTKLTNISVEEIKDMAAMMNSGQLIRNVEKIGLKMKKDYFVKYSEPKILSTNELTKLRNLSVEEIKDMAAMMNSDQLIRNLDKFGFKVKKDSVVILIQVHTRVDTLAILVESLRHVRFINETLVIFSHDVYDIDVFKLVQSIDFCPVMQLFYPFAVQTHDKVFPGSHPNDCPRNLNLTSARQRRCNNAEYPDKFKHYREAHICQIRHHWLWMLHFAFDRVRILSGFNGTFLRLEDDNYLASDVIHFIRKLNLKRSEYPDNRMYIMGDQEGFSTASFKTSSNIAVEDFYYIGIGGGLAFTRQFWNDFRDCSKFFCTDDDYNWDFALHHTAVACFWEGLRVIKSVASRVFHIGTCQGVHRHYKNCKVETVKNNTESVLKTFSAKLFPEAIRVISSPKTKKKQVQKNGGWGDPRDHHLCMNMMNDVNDDEHSLMEIHRKYTANKHTSVIKN